MSGCFLIIDNYRYGQYLSGAVVDGRVVCSFRKPKSIRGIRVKLKGREHTEWIGHESRYNHHTKRHERRPIYYTGNNTFLALEQTLSSEGDYPEGRHEYHFTFSLPEGIPSTYIGKFGWIRYTVKALVDRPFKTDYDDTREIIVISPIDFNVMPGIQMHPLTYTDEKTLCCFCCTKGAITMNVYIEKDAFVQGETARIKMSIMNMSTENVTRVELKIKITTQYKVTLPKYDTKYEKETIVYTSDTGVGAHGERIYEFPLKISETAVIPNFSLCKLFEKWATLKVTAILNGVHRNMEIAIPIKLGHIPLGAHQQYQLPAYPLYATAASCEPAGDQCVYTIPVSQNSMTDINPNAPHQDLLSFAPSKAEIMMETMINNLPPTTVAPYESSGDQDMYTISVPQTSMTDINPNAPPLDPVSFAPSKAEIMMEEIINNTPPSTAPPPSYSETMKYATQP